MPRKEYCCECEKDVNVLIKEETIDKNIKGIQFSYIGSIAYCEECGNEVYVGELSDENVRKANEIYRGKLDIIKTSEIEALLQKYNIGKEPLANLLGWGEKTIVRYCTGLMPSKEYSDRLRELMNPFNMKELFDKRKEVLTEVAAKKLEASIQESAGEYLKDERITNISEIGKYLLNGYGYSVSIDQINDKQGEGWLVKVPELQGCLSYGKTLNNALADLDAAIEAWIYTASKKGKRIPKSKVKKAEEEYNGSLVVNIPKTLHRQLALKAENENISVNELVSFILTREMYKESEEGNTSQKSIMIDTVNDLWSTSDLLNNLTSRSDFLTRSLKGGRSKDATF